MFCNNCGTQVPDGSAVCSNCGRPLYEDRQQPAQPQYAYQQPYAAQPAAQPVPSTPLVFGILSLALGPILAIIFGALGIGKAKSYVAAGGQYAGKIKVGKILSTIGLICGIVGTVLLVIFIILLITGRATFNSIYNNYYTYSY